MSVPNIKQLITFEDNVANGRAMLVFPIIEEITKRIRLPNPPPINTNR